MTALPAPLAIHPPLPSGGFPPPARYAADPGQLRSLATGLRRIHDAILGLGRVDPGIGTTAELGSAAVAESLREVGSSWSAARARLGQELDALARAGEMAAHAYATVDGDVLGALSASSHSSRPAR